MAVEDAISLTKQYLDAYLRAASITDDNGDEIKFHVQYADPDYPLTRVFKDKNIGVLFCIGKPESRALMNADQIPWGYDEQVPITTWTVDKTDLTAAKVLWKAEAELRYVCESYPTGSQRKLDRMTENTQRIGSTILYSVQYMLSYRRDTT